MTRVKNVSGSSRFAVPNGYSSGCSNSDLVGAHVQKANSSDKSWYITPLCKACNQRTDEFDVFWDLVPVPSNL